MKFSPAEARNLRIRSEAMTALRKFIEKEGLTQAEAAKRLKVSQPRISDLTRGKVSRFSLDTLVNMLTDAGMDVVVKIAGHGRPRTAPGSRPSGLRKRPGRSTAAAANGVTTSRRR